MAKNDKFEIWSLDEAHFQQHGTRCTMWVAPEDKDPIQLLAPTRKSVSQFGAINLRVGSLITQVAEKFNALTFESFLKKLLSHRAKGKRMMLILDNARYHHAKLLKPFLHKHRRILKLVFLPPYSPNLNPIERVWKLTRRLCTHNRYFASFEQLVTALSKQMDVWATPNETLRRLCCII